MKHTRPLVLTTLAASLLWLSGCDGNAANGAAQDAAPQAQADAEAPATAAAPAGDAIEGLPFASTAIATFNEPWAIGFLPDGSVLVTEKNGVLKHVSLPGGETREISGVPAVGYGGQGGLGDVKPHPQFSQNGIVYLSYAEDGEGGRGAAVARARLDLDAGALQDVSVVWRQVPKVSGNGHYGHRIAFDGDGKLWISSGERQKFDPSQSMQSNMGKMVRLNDDGSVPDDNPFAGKGEIASQVWSLGHRNPLGIAFDAQGRLWNSEMGPAGGDELNLVKRGANYGYPIVSNGDHYDGKPIPDHDTRPEFEKPAITWTPVISPSSLMFYSGTLFPEWTGNAFIGGLSGQTLVRIEIDGESAREAERFAMGGRIRDVQQGPDGALYIIEDGQDGRLIRLAPREG